MSKSLMNYPDPLVVFDTHGSDAMRWYLLGSPILRGNDLMVTDDGLRETVRQVLLPIWNTWYFLSLYANAAGTVGSIRTDSADVLDRYVLAKTHDLVADLTGTMDEYDLFAACGSVRGYLDVLTNWYVRRSRERFWAGDQDAIDTLHTVLTLACRSLAPLLPMLTEHVYRGLTGARSVHLTEWPDATSIPADAALVESMDLVRDVCSVALRVRKDHQLRVRQPLAALTIAVEHASRLEPFRSLIADEVNVKSVLLSDDVASVAGTDIELIPAAFGKRLGGATQSVIKAVRAGDWQHGPDGVVAGGIALLEGEYVLRLVTAGDGAQGVLATAHGVVSLDTALTPELEAEGLTRDLIRIVQDARKDAGLRVSDRIRLTLGVSEAVRRRVTAFQSLLTDATLTVDLVWAPGTETAELDGEAIHVSVERAG
jgi:isoleucyl-tRNA synthetase